jgi:hypothetical protein
MSTPLAFLVLALAVMALWILDNERRAEQAQARRAARLAALTTPQPASRR